MIVDLRSKLVLLMMYAKSPSPLGRLRERKARFFVGLEARRSRCSGLGAYA
jgi:hypothetical protein